MIPVLFKKNEQQFRSYGLGPIHDIISPKVTRERNGQYLLYFQYPQDAEFADVFEEDMRIKSDAGVRTKWQTFEITRVVRKEGQLIEVFAKHISQSLLKDALNPSVSVRSLNAEQALRIWNNNRIGDEEFDVWSDISTTSSTNWDIRDVSNAFEALAGVQGSILDVWGGEYEFDNKLIRLHKEMGRKSPVPLEYGRNITGLEQDQQEDNVYTSVYPFATYTAEGDNQPKTVTLPERYIDGKYLEFHNKRKIQVVDFSGEFESDDIPTVSRLRTLTENYLNANEVGLPHENLKVEYIDLSKTLDYQEFQTMEEVELNDRLPIFYPKFGITNENAKVVVINYDPVKEENISIELGVIGQSFRTVTTGGLGSRLDRVEKQQDATNNYIVNAKGNRIWFETPNEDMEHKIGDTWFEKNGPYDRIRVWNGNQWETIIDSEDIDKNAKAIAAQQQEIEDARQVADEAVDEINTAIQNAGFTSLDDTLQNMNYITMNAEQNAQQAITDANNAHDLAQTSISEAQTAQENSLTALGQVEDVQTGVSDLEIRVDDVEAELELKADNTFMNEDGTLTTLSNAITFNAHRFSSDMSRIESRVESLAGEINLVILRDAIKGTRLMGGEVYPNATPYSQSNTMREMINVTPGEKLAISKETPSSGYNYFTINFYDENYVYKSLLHTQSNQQVITIPPGIYKMWVAYPAGSKPQIVRGTQFLPYRPSIADQMTTDEMVLFRNEYDEYADRTERRLSAIDSTGGSLDILDNKIVTTAERVTTDMTALIDTKVGDDEFTEFYQNEYLETAQEVSRKISLSDIKIGGRNLLKNTSPNEVTSLTEREYFLASPLSVGYYKVSFEAKASVPTNASVYINDNTGQNRVRQRNFPSVSLTTEFKRFEVEIEIYEADSVSIDNISLRVRSAGINITDKFMKLEKGNVATGWERAPEDEDAKIAHIETEWTQTFEDFEFAVSDNQGKVNRQLQTLENSLSAINDPTTGRLTIAEQSLDGFRNEVYNADGSSKITQLATGVQSLVTDITKLEGNFKNLLPDSEKRVGGIGNDTLIGGTPGSLIYQNIPVKPNTTYSLRYVAYVNSPTLVVLTFSDFASNIQTHNQAYAHGNRIREFKLASTQSFTTAPNERYIAISTGNSRENNRENYVDYRNLQLEEGASTDWTGAHPLNSYASQITQLSNNINLRVAKGELLSQINVEADRMLFQSDKILMDANNVTFTGKAWIPSSVIGDLEADKITSGRLDASKVSVVNLDFDTAVGNRTEFIQSAWNSINSNLTITGNSLVYTHSKTGNMTLMSADGLMFIDGGRNYQTNYLFDIYTITGLQHQPNSPYWYQLPDVYKNKDFKALTVFSDAYGVTNDPSYDELVTLRIITYVDRPNIDRKNGRVPIYGYHRARRLSDGRIRNYAIQVQLLVQY